MNTEFIPQTPPLWQTQLAFELLPSDTTATLADEFMIDGVALSGLVMISVDIGQPNPEYIIGDLSGNLLTISVRNCKPLDPLITTGVFSSTHRAGAVVKITDFGSIQIMRNILQGLTPLQNPLVSPTPATDPDQVPNLSQLQSAIISGGIPATELNMGIVRLAKDLDISLGTVTITIASPAVITKTAHGLTVNDIVEFSTTGALPTGITAGIPYYVIGTGLTANDFQISLTAGGTAVNTTGTQSGVQSVSKTTPVALSGTKNTNEALRGSSSTPTNENPFLTQNDTTNGATETATTIAFVNSNPDTITDSGNGFVNAGFQAGQTIIVTGSVSNNGTYTIFSVSAGTITLVSGDSLTAESAGATVTISAAVNNKLIRTNTNGTLPVEILPNSIVIEALENIDAGDFVKIQANGSDAGVRKVFGIGDSTAGFSASAQAGTPVAVATNVNVIALSPTLVVAFGVVSNNTSSLYRYYVAGTVSGKTITWGTVVYDSIGTNTTTEYRLIKVNSTAFVIMANNFAGSSFIPECFVATVSGTTITVGSAQNLGYSISGSDDYRIYDGVLVDTNKICFVLNDSPATDTNGIVCDVDTTAKTLTPGAEFQVSSSVSSNTARVHLLSTNRVLFTYLSSYRVCTISGSTLTSVATGSLPSGTITRFRFMKGATNSEGLAAWYDATDCKIAKCVESSGTLTFSLEEDLSTGSASGLSATLDNLQLYNSAMNKWLVIPVQTSSPTVRIAMLDTNSIVLDSSINTAGTATSGYMTGVIDNEKFVQIATIGNSTSPYLVASLDYQDSLGIAQKTVTTGQDTFVVPIGGKDNNQTGLQPGFIYYLNAGANLTIASSDITNTITFTSKKVGYSLSATAISLSNS